MIHAHNFVDISGRRYGRVTVLRYVGYADASRHSVWRCRCDCGVEFDTFGAALRRGRTRSCGCYRSELARRKVSVAYAASSLPVRISGLGDFPSGTAAANALGCAPATVLKYARLGAKYNDHHITFIKKL